MGRAADKPRRSCLAGAWLAGICAAAGTIGVLTWSGCSVQKHYKTLSFFFDGVPRPGDAPNLTAAEQLAAMRASPTYVVHKPYAEEKCNDCHGARFELTSADSTVCLKCHADTPLEHKEMHGPVAAVACLWCHSPHESAHRALLKAEPNDVCSQCHVPRMLDARRVPAHADPSQSCLSCHGAHGGEARFFLKAGAPTGAGG